MKKTIFSLLALVCFALSPIWSVAAEQDGVDFFGSISAGFRLVDENSDNQARFLEYYDFDDDLLADLTLGWHKDAWFCNLEATDIGLDDQQYYFKLINFGSFAGEVFYQEFTHSLSLDAKAPYAGIGGPDLELLTSDNLHDFDYDVERKEYGGEVNFSFGTPFYVSFAVQRRQEDGLKPLGSGNSWFNVELPEPIDYTTDDLSLTLGYRGETVQIAIKGFWSDFDNDDESMTRPLDDAVVTLAPDNDYGKIAAQLSWRNLPLDSMLAARVSYAKLENDLSLKELGLKPSPEYLRSSFDGEITYTRASLALTSRPLEQLDTRLYCSFLDKDNDSSPISAEHAKRIFDFNEEVAGVDVAWQLQKNTSVTAAYEYRDIDRHNLLAGDHNRDHSFSLELKNHSLDFLVAKLRYRRLDRDGDNDYISGTDPVSEGDEWIRRYIKNFDVADKTMDEFRLAFELYPRENFDLALSYAFCLNDYDKSDLGLTKDRRHEFNADFIWRMTTALRLGGFAGYEMTETDSRHRQFAVGESADIHDSSGAAFNWHQENKADYWSCGLSFDWLNLIDKLNLNLSWQYHNSDGKIDFSAAGQNLADIHSADDYDLQKLELKLSYALRDNTTVTFGYMYEKYDGDDLQFADYEAFQTDGMVPGSYLSGAYFDDDFQANTAYLMLSYNF